jgi:hypothetical protein
MEETLRRVVDYERKNGEAEDLYGVIRRLFRSVVASLFRKSYYNLRLQPIGNHDREAVPSSLTATTDVSVRMTVCDGADFFRQIAAQPPRRLIPPTTAFEVGSGQLTVENYVCAFLEVSKHGGGYNSEWHRTAAAPKGSVDNRALERSFRL